MNWTVKQFADLVGVSVRTLHHYDRIGLLAPDRVNPQNGYRYYGDTAFCRMQEILFYRALDFPLGKIREILSSPHHQRQEALKGQRELLRLKKERIQQLLDALDHAAEGEEIMMPDNQFEQMRTQYKGEAKARWGNTATWAEHEEKTADYTAAQWQDTATGLDALLADFAAAHAAGTIPAATTALVKRLQDFITKTQYTCTDEILAALGEMYVADERFTQNIDRHGTGTAAFIHEAIAAYVNTR